MSKIEELKEIIATNERFAIISHLSPDGDNLGSIIAMSNYLNDLGKTVYPIELDNIPGKFRFITDSIVFYDHCNFEVDVLITLDCADRRRLGDIDNLFETSKKVIKIDHHSSGDEYADLSIVESKISSTCELLTEIFLELDANFTPDISTALFMGILTDTGRFLFDSANSRTFEIASFLCSKGAEKELLMDKIFQSESLNAKRAQLEILKNASFYYDSKLVILEQSLALLDKYGVTDTDVENVINYFRESLEVCAVALIKEISKDNYKVSLRSKGNINVCEIAKKYGGGGHINASGLKIEAPFKVVEQKIIEGFDIIDK